MLKFGALLALTSLIPAFVEAVAPVWGQCGGNGWSGETACASGSTCVKSNDWYSQCITSSTQASSTVQSSTAAQPSTTSTPAAGNPYDGYEIYLSPYYADEVIAAAAAITDPTLKAKALKVKDIPTFTWFDVVAKTSQLGTYLADADAKAKTTGKKYLVQIVVYDLPDRDCAALASNGEFTIANNGLNNYKGYVDKLAAEIKKFPNVRVIAVIEPDSLANMVTNMGVTKCQGAASAYKEGTIYAVKKLSELGVYSYLDAGHAGWLGWLPNLTPAAELFAQIYKDAGSPPFLRGLATDVANYNAYTTTSPDPVTQGSPNYDELKYITSLAPELQSRGFPAHFIVDQGRSGVQNIRKEWGDWCNVKNAGFGTRPTLNTGSSLVDSIVWIKPGGECDGTSNTSAVRYDGHCGKESAHKPAPEAGTWFQAYFENLVKYANPAL
ncbi:cellobiohydrolase II-I [Crucibulum laeve]|uniref:Glucanase n=1 Tax=Crucibulum laeve TaxID=68775 RepID=A0A5C3M515_9AGAR|nr:cellobiohydrolase II-I [Crucibulum laeve]